MSLQHFFVGRLPRAARHYLVLPVLGATLAVLVFEPPLATWAMVMNVLCLGGVVLILATLTLRPALSLAVAFSGYALMFLFHHWKMAHLKTPLMVTDLLGGQTLWLTAHRYLRWKEALAMAAIVAIPLSILAVPRLRLPIPLARRWRGIVLAGMLTFLGSFYFLPEATWPRWLSPLGRRNLRWDPRGEVQHQGVLLSQLLALPYLRVDAPPGYSEASVTATVQSARETATAAAPTPPVDVVVYLMESFADPRRWQIPLTRDPIPRFRELAAKHASGVLHVPVTGGGTANVEFETLTGMNTTLFRSQDVIPYQRYIHRALDALPRVFATNGYRSVAIHPNDAGFWSRDQVYPRLGFSAFVSSKGFRHAGKPWDTPDEALIAPILSVLDAETPAFVFAITIAAHGPYEKPSPQMRVGPFTAAQLPAPWEHYLQELHQSDEALGKLVDAMAKRKRPTLLVAFGDHLPALPQIDRVLRDPDDLYVTPLLVWSNFSRPRETLDENPSSLGARILAWTGLPVPERWRFRAAAAQQVTWLGPRHLRRRAGGRLTFDRIHRATGNADVDPLLEALWLLQYDQLFGANYAQSAATGTLPAK